MEYLPGEKRPALAVEDEDCVNSPFQDEDLTSIMNYLDTKQVKSERTPPQNVQTTNPYINIHPLYSSPTLSHKFPFSSISAQQAMATSPPTGVMAQNNGMMNTSFLPQTPQLTPQQVQMIQNSQLQQQQFFQHPHVQAHFLAQQMQVQQQLMAQQMQAQQMQNMMQAQLNVPQPQQHLKPTSPRPAQSSPRSTSSSPRSPRPSPIQTQTTSNTLSTGVPSPQPMSPRAPPSNLQTPVPPQTAQAPQQPHQIYINDVLKLHVTQKEQLDKMRIVQSQIMINPSEEAFALLDAEQNALKQQIDAELTSLRQIDATYILGPTEIRQAVFLLHELTIQSIQLELFHDELQLLIHPQNPPPCIAALVIIEQPFPMVITKGKPLEDDPVVVQLLSGSRVEFQSIGKVVKATMVVDGQPAKSSASSKVIETEVVSMDETNKIAKYNLKFLNGTRKNPVALKFSMQVQVVGGTGTVMVESPPSHPFIVITNECQYEESDGTLLKKDSFGNAAEISWFSFANKLQRHFLRATRQDPIRPSRYLSRHELMYIHSNYFGGQANATQTNFDPFWQWFGKGLQKLRYQRHVCSMWQSGLIYGFISRSTVEDALRREEPGTFLIRFSERHAGLFAVGYRVEGEECVRHYLVRPDDTAGAKKTLPDFLAYCPQFTRILQMTIDPNTGDPKFRSYPKEVVLEPYYSKKDALTSTAGYDNFGNAV